MIEENRLKYSDIGSPTVENAVRFAKTLPLFAWRGMGFSNYPLLSIMLSLSVFLAFFTRYRALSIIALSTNGFHVILTHNIPRYHAIELGVMFLTMALLFDVLSKRCIDKYQTTKNAKLT